MSPTINCRGTLEERFAKYFSPGPEDECWPWEGTTNDKGYGQLHNIDHLEYAHRIAYEFASGEKLHKKEKVQHSCDNPPCVNPYHLSRGTAKTNTQDMYQKGRNVNATGTRNGKSKLRPEEVSAIKKCLAGKIAERKIAKMFGISHGAIHAIARGTTWKQVV